MSSQAAGPLWHCRDQLGRPHQIVGRRSKGEGSMNFEETLSLSGAAPAAVSHGASGVKVLSIEFVGTPWSGLMNCVTPVGSVAAIATRRIDFRQFFEVKFADLARLFRRTGVLEGLRGVSSSQARYPSWRANSTATPIAQRRERGKNDAPALSQG